MPVTSSQASMAGHTNTRLNIVENQIEPLAAQIAELVRTVEESCTHHEIDSNEAKEHHRWIGGEGHHRQRQEREYQPPTRFTKMEFPKFQRGNVLEWLLKCNQYFQIDNTPDAWKVMAASTHLDEKAFQQHQTLMHARRRCVIGWEEYSEAIHKRFGPTYEAPMVELMRLTNRESQIL